MPSISNFKKVGPGGLGADDGPAVVQGEADAEFVAGSGVAGLEDLGVTPTKSGIVRRPGVFSPQIS
jgi:hypothetical protein